MPKFVHPLESRTLLATHPLSDLPQLSSLPGAPANLYLDFNGDTARSWGGFNVPAQGAYSFDADRTTFSDVELDTIEETWLFVADHFAPFNLNVTTGDPGVDDRANKTLRV